VSRAAPSGAARNVYAVAGRRPAQIIDLGTLSLDQKIITGVVGHPKRLVRVRQTLVDRRRQLAHTVSLPARGEVRSTHGMELNKKS